MKVFRSYFQRWLFVAHPLTTFLRTCAEDAVWAGKGDVKAILGASADCACVIL